MSTRLPSPAPDAPGSLLGDLSAAAFMRRIWHRHAHLIRQAIAGFSGFLDRESMFHLAQQDDVESRLVLRNGDGWELRHGPFRARELATLPPRNWTLLVQGVDLHDDRGADLLRRFRFLPRARLDDLMVSYAVPGGGVGPHFDSYDVFLLQGPGRRRWQVGAQRNLELVDGLPVKILRDFRPTAEWILEPGDMLYLPPRFAHDGVAVDKCLTYSIGFRAPGHAELASGFFGHLADGIDLSGRYEDAGATATKTPGRLPPRLVDAADEVIRSVRWQRRDVEAFLGRYLSEPKPHVFFDPPARTPSVSALARALETRTLTLHRKSQLLYGNNAVFMNGEVYRFPRGVPEVLRRLADEGEIGLRPVPSAVAALLQDWFGDGFLVWRQRR